MYQLRKLRKLKLNVTCQVRGGNANNSATVLAHLGFPAEYFGTFAASEESEWLRAGMGEDGVKLGPCPQ